MVTRFILLVLLGTLWMSDMLCAQQVSALSRRKPIAAAGGDSFSGTTRYVNTDNSTSGDGTTNETDGSADSAYKTLLEAVNAMPGTLTTPWRIYCTGTAEDLSNLNQTPWDMTTSAANYIWIIGEQSPNHPNASRTGAWSDSLYRIACTNRSAFYMNYPGHVRVEGLQIRIHRSSGSGYIALKLPNSNANYADCDYRASYCAVKHTGANNDGNIGYELRPAGQAGGTARVWNCTAWNFGTGFQSDFLTGEFYNCTSYGHDYGFVENDTDACKVVNCIAANASGIGFVGTFASGSNYNSENDGNGAPGANSNSAVTFTFSNASAGDFHLASGDAGAKDLGTSSVGGLFTDDIDGQTRSGTWDIGADEYQ